MTKPAYYGTTLRDIAKIIEAVESIEDGEITLAGPIPVLLDGDKFGQLVYDGEGTWSWEPPA